MVNVVTWVFVAAAAVQVLYYLAVYVRLAVHKAKQAPTPDALPPVTVLICARDEAHNLRKYLPAVCTQDYPNDYEVLVVNDLSSDDTMEVLFDLGRQYERLDYRTIPEQAKVLQGKKFALTIGVKAAKYPRVVLIDADCYPSSPLWLQRMATCFTDEKQVVLGFGAYEKRPGFLNKLIRFETFNTALNYLSFALSGLPYMGVGRNLAYTRSMFFATNVFVKNPKLASGDDDLLINAVATGRNTAVCIHKEAFTVSGPKLTWDEWLYQKRRHVSTARHYKWGHRAMLALFQLAHVLFYAGLILTLVYTRNYVVVGGVFAARLFVMSVVHYFALKKLDSVDLWIWTPLFDLLTPLYYLAVLPGVTNKHQHTWK
jgi:cellulose synthase/poly-beta-1,6-N-acetylglucosamine synthase-like glycosyltransferase